MGMGRVIRKSGGIANKVTPYIGRLIILIGKLMFLSIISFWIGVEETLDRMAEEWSQNGPAHERTEKIYRIFSTIMIIIGWIILAHLTVWLIGVLF